MPTFGIEYKVLVAQFLDAYLICHGWRKKKKKKIKRKKYPKQEDDGLINFRMMCQTTSLPREEVHCVFVAYRKTFKVLFSLCGASIETFSTDSFLLKLG